MKNKLPRVLLFLIYCFTINYVDAQKLSLSAFVSGLDMPIDIKNCGDDRLFIAERPGRIRVVNGQGTLLATPMVNFVSKVSSTNCEEGFLGMAFSPNHKTDRKLYVNYTADLPGGLHTIIEEYKVSATDSNVVDPSSALELMRIAQPYCNHNGGNMMFGKDGYLYIAMGDGGSGGDPLGNGQNRNTLLGKMLRIDISNTRNTPPFYDIPTSNPFFNDNTSGIKKEIWAYGLRNPFRASVDRITGDIWIADVGQNAREEVDFQPFTSAGGVNYGWKTMEGNLCYSPSSGCNTAGLQLPIYDYPRSNGYSITGGYVYRSVHSKYLYGMYLFSDFGTEFIDGFRQTNGVRTGGVERLIPGSLVPGGPIGYGEDMYGDQYVCLNNVSTIYKLSDTSHLRRPEAIIASTELSGSDYTLRALRGKNVSYQWLKDGQPISGAQSPDYTTNGGGAYQLELTNDLNRKDTSDPFTLGVLSVSLQDFNAKLRADKNVELSWRTVTEFNQSGFIVERRKSSEADFRYVAFIPSQSVNGNSSSILNYSFIDQQPDLNEKMYYRLRIVQLDNSFSFSEIRTINVRNGKGYSIYPNPAVNSAMIDLSGISLPVTMNLYDVQGKRISSKIISSSAYKIDLNSLKGIFFVEIYNATDRPDLQKLIVE